MMDLRCQPVVMIRWLQIYLKMYGLKNSSSSIAELSITKTQQKVITGKQKTMKVKTDIR